MLIIIKNNSIMKLKKSNLKINVKFNIFNLLSLKTKLIKKNKNN